MSSSVHPRIGLAAGIVLAAVLMTPASAEASGGGGCGGPITDWAAGSHAPRTVANPRLGPVVEIRRFCFTPTVLRVPVGTRVAFTNLDPADHNVLGSNAVWGSFEVMSFDRTLTYAFRRSGVFPYACSLHPGMVGAIVVGDPTSAPEASSGVPVADPGDPVVSVHRASGADPDPAEHPVWVLGIGASLLALPLAWAIGRGQRRPGGPTGR